MKLTGRYEYCPLCHHAGQPFYKDSFFQCSQCQGIFRPAEDLLPPKKEKLRYEKHNNDVHDPGYQSFVEPITSAVMRDFPLSAQGLDYGAGTGPVISKILMDEGYKVNLYDPFFFDRPKALERTYDYIVCCEVMEHFHQPDEEFALLQSLLKSGGKLYCMTDPFLKGMDFETWRYKNDITHVFIYTPTTLDWITNHYGFKAMRRNDRLIIFEK